MARNYLGKGWKYPVEVDRGGGIPMSELDESIRQSIHIILGTAPGERVMHLGCGAGYYTAILAELIGPAGEITAIDIHPEMARRARDALAPWPQVEARHADGASAPLQPYPQE